MPPEERLEVWAHSTFYLTGEAEKYRVGEFDDCEEALAACRNVVDDFLETCFEAGMSVDDLVAEYEAAGPDPYLVPRGDCLFAAREYARERAEQICSAAG